MGFYLKRTVRRDTPEDVAYRIAYAKMIEQVNAETAARYPQITAENFVEAVRFKDARIAELLAAMAAG